jgi:RNA polymerase sigma factor (sigma-70 family)
MNDLELLQACAARNEDAWKEFLNRYSRLLYGGIIAAFKRHGQSTEIEKIEETYCSFIEHLVAGDCRVLRSFRGENGCSLGSWLRVLVVNHTLDAMRGRADRSRSREVPLADAVTADLEQGREFGPEAVLSKAEAERMLAGCMRELTAKEKLFVRFYYYDGIDVGRIAKILRISESGVYALKARLTRKLQDSYRRFSS